MEVLKIIKRSAAMVRMGVVSAIKAWWLVEIYMRYLRR